MAGYDLVVRGASIVGTGLNAGEGSMRADVAVADGKIAAVSPDLAETGGEELDARGLHAFPGAIDAHVHFNEPGRTDWEGFVSGTRALAAGGATSYAEMPLNAYPPTLDAASFNLKLRAAKAASLVDFALWGGLVPGPVERLDELAEMGVAGFKAFMSTSGTPDFQPADDLTLYEGMERAAGLGLPVLVHAENKAITDALAGRAASTLRATMRDYLDSRPVVAELEAIERAILFAEETGCSLHVVHVSTGRGVALVAAARARGANVTCETCPHYLVLTEEDAEELGALAKCAPPLRSRQELELLWAQVFEGNVGFVASDHSPAPPETKVGTDFFRVWGGISGCQSLFNVMLDEGHHKRRLPLARVAELVSGNVAACFGFPEKGRLEVGADADLALVDLAASFTLKEEDLLYRHKMSPFVGRTFRGRVARTILRGTTVFRDGRVVSEPVGQLIRPRRGAEKDPSRSPPRSARTTDADAKKPEVRREDKEELG